MLSVRINRFEQDERQTLGDLMVMKEDAVIFACKTLELDWQNNEVKKSCIPTGKYRVLKRYSEKYGCHFHILDVPDRSYVLIHIGNYHTQTEGCILVGKSHIDINKDGYRDVTASKDTMKELNDILPDSFNLTII